jgi:hypothetical protein
LRHRCAGASIAFSTPPRAAVLQATRLTGVAATQLPPTQGVWLAASTTLASQPWHATLKRTAPMPHRTPRALAPPKLLIKSFDYSLYASTCRWTCGYTAYSSRSDTVMACRTYHLGVAAMAGNAENALPPCRTRSHWPLRRRSSEELRLHSLRLHGQHYYRLHGLFGLQRHSCCQPNGYGLPHLQLWRRSHGGQC